jgi:hypothetical protein
MMTDHIFPTGKFTYTIGEYSPVVEIDGQGKMTLSLSGEVIVVSKYQVMGNIIEVEDVEGSYAGPEYGVGKYQWQYTGNIITFKLIEDRMPPRLKAFAVPWHKVERPILPYFFEGNQP